MKWYFASRMRHREKINKISDFLRSHNHEIVYDWFKLGQLKPYAENADEASLVASKISSSLRQADVFVLFADKSGTDMFVELGMVIALWQDNKNLKIYAVGEFNNRSLMHFHPAIKRVDNLSDVFKELVPELLDKAGSILDTRFM